MEQPWLERKISVMLNNDTGQEPRPMAIVELLPIVLRDARKIIKNAAPHYHGFIGLLDEIIAEASK